MDPLLEHLFRACYDARRNKRNTPSALRFETHYESNLFKPYEEIRDRRYELRPGISSAIPFSMILKRLHRYVGDFFLIHADKEYLKQCIQWIREFLWERLMLVLHPKKIYLQNFRNGVKFLGVMIKPYRSYVDKKVIHRLRMVLSQVVSDRNSAFADRHLQSPLESYLDFLLIIIPTCYS